MTTLHILETSETSQLEGSCKIVEQMLNMQYHHWPQQPKPADKHLRRALLCVVREREEKEPHKLVFDGIDLELYKCACGVFTDTEFWKRSENYDAYKDVAQDLIKKGRATRPGYLWDTEFRCEGCRVTKDGVRVGSLGYEAFETVEWPEKHLGTETGEFSDFDQTLEMWMTVPVLPGCEEESWRLRMEAAYSKSGVGEKLQKLMGQGNVYQARIDHDAFLVYANMCGVIEVEGVNTNWARSMNGKAACLTKQGGAVILHGSSYCVRKMELEWVPGQPKRVRVCKGHLDSVYFEDGWLVIV